MIPLSGAHVEAPHLDSLQQPSIDSHPGKVRTIAEERLEPLAHKPLKVAFGLLEMLRAEERPR
jgi:hypothetical protein